MRVLSSSATGTDVLSATFDHMPQEVMVLDNRATVVLVNDAYLRFGRENGLAHPEACIGQNYLNICLTAALGGDPSSARIAHALREVLTGQRDSYETVYPCHSPMEERWFRMTATPWAREGQHGAVLVHEDVTFDRIADEAMQRAREPARPRQEAARPFPLQPGLDALAQRVEAATGVPMYCEGAADVWAVAPVRRWLEALARVLLRSTPMKGHPIILSATRGRDVQIQIHGLRDLVGREELEALPATVMYEIRESGPLLTVRLRARKEGKRKAGQP